jgi:hypothetical protein
MGAGHRRLNDRRTENAIDLDPLHEGIDIADRS